jgi:hypothetical protein
MSRFEFGASNGVHEVKVDTSLKNLNNVRSCKPLDASTLNSNHKMDNIHFI